MGGDALLSLLQGVPSRVGRGASPRSVMKRIPFARSQLSTKHSREASALFWCERLAGAWLGVVEAGAKGPRDQLGGM
jgi:hypothetical protein